MALTINADEARMIEGLVAYYQTKQGLIRRFLESLHGPIADAITSPEPLSTLVHSVKRRMKEPSHLRDKLIRKLWTKKTRGEQFDITEENLLLRINDLGGYRILHLH